jgi:M6 family metalloprotease-like protein
MKKSSILFVILLAFMFIPITIVYAVPADPNPISFTQPNGVTLTVRVMGDERIHWYESMDEYTLLLNKEGYLSYAQLDENMNLQPSEYIAIDIEQRDIVITSFLTTINKKLFYSEMQIQMMFKIWEIEDEAAKNAPLYADGVIGKLKSMVSLVEFSDKKLKYGISDFENILNQIGYTGNNHGSLRDYFREVSYGLLDIEFRLFGPFLAPKALSYYKDHTGELARWLATQIQGMDVSFEDFDGNKDKFVDNFHFLFAGMGAENGTQNTIWSHKSSFSPPVYKNGVQISIYSCSPELKSATKIAGIGTMAHEMTHTFGAADFYDTDDTGSGGKYPGTDTWDLMGSGNYNGNSDCPAHQNMYVKIQFGWITPQVLSSPGTISNIPNSAENPIAYRINTKTNKEYYLLENRQKIKFDKYIPGNGLLIYHVHAGVESGSCVNCKHPQRMYPVVATRTVQMPNADPKSYGTVSRAVFPGSSSVTAFTDDSTPAMWDWANHLTEKPIYDITHQNSLISFVFRWATGIDETTKNNSSLQIVPNPATDYIELQITNYELLNQQIDFYNNYGQLVKSIPFNGVTHDHLTTQRVSVSDFAKGLYFVNIGNCTAKVIVQ